MFSVVYQAELLKNECFGRDIQGRETENLNIEFRAQLFEMLQVMTDFERVLFRD